MDLENKPNMKRTRIGGGYMVVGYGSGGGIWIRIGGGIWIRIGDGILIEAKVSRISIRWWLSFWRKSTLTIRLRTCEDVAP